LAAAVLCAGLTYGAMGVALGSLLHKEVEGMFALGLISILDFILQNPLFSSGVDSPTIRTLPSYGAVQAAMAASFSTQRLLECLMWQLAVFAVAALFGILAFHRRTRNALRSSAVGLTARGA
jgi:hypothetical protein